MKKSRFFKCVAIALVTLILATTLIACGGKSPQGVGPKKKFTVMWSIYVGWMPWPYAQESGILQKWADKYNIVIDLKEAGYIPSIEAYVAGEADAVVMTNMEALNMAAAAGVDTTAVIVGDYSNGNDAVLTRNGLKLRDLRGKTVYLVELSVSQYLLARGLEKEGQGLTEGDLKLVNVSDADIAPAFITSKGQEVVVTWNPMVVDIESQVSVTNAFNSSQIPHEILDIMFVRTDVLSKHPELAKALVGAWYETLALMQGKGPETEKALASMAQKSGASLAQYKKQLETTYMYWQSADAASFTRSRKLVEVMDLVRKFSFDHGMFGEGVKSVDAVGILFPDGTILGNPKNVKLRFADKYMQFVAGGK